MKGLLILPLIVLVAAFGNSASGMDKKAVDELIKKMEKKVDPKGLKKKIKTQVSKVEMFIPAQQIRMNLTVIQNFLTRCAWSMKFPD
jgi:protein associated with RNAse G/E